MSDGDMEDARSTGYKGNALEKAATDLKRPRSTVCRTVMFGLTSTIHVDMHILNITPEEIRAGGVFSSTIRAYTTYYVDHETIKYMLARFAQTNSREKRTRFFRAVVHRTYRRVRFKCGSRGKTLCRV